MDTGLRGRTVLITGASRNIGRLAAIAFAREGANLAICTSTKLKQLEEDLPRSDMGWISSLDTRLYLVACNRGLDPQYTQSEIARGTGV